MAGDVSRKLNILITLVEANPQLLDKYKLSLADLQKIQEQFAATQGKTGDAQSDANKKAEKAISDLLKTLDAADKAEVNRQARIEAQTQRILDREAAKKAAIEATAAAQAKADEAAAKPTINRKGGSNSVEEYEKAEKRRQELIAQTAKDDQKANEQRIAEAKRVADAIAAEDRKSAAQKKAELDATRKLAAEYEAEREAAAQKKAAAEARAAEAAAKRAAAEEKANRADLDAQARIQAVRDQGTAKTVADAKTRAQATEGEVRSIQQLEAEIKRLQELQKQATSPQDRQQIGGALKAATAELAAAQAQVRTLQTAFDDFFKSIGSGNASLGTFTKLIADIGTAAGPSGVAIAALVTAATGAVSALKNATEEASKFQLIVRGISQLTDVSEDRVAAVTASIQKFGLNSLSAAIFLERLNLKVSEAGKGGREAKDAFAAFGVSVFDAAGNLKNTGIILDEIVQKTKNLALTPAQVEASKELFTLRGAKAIEAIEQFYDGQLKAVRKFNVVLSAEQAKNLQVFRDSALDLEKSLQQVTNVAGAAAAPGLGQLNNLFVDLIRNSEITSKESANLVSAFLELVNAAVMPLVEGLGTLKESSIFVLEVLNQFNQSLFEAFSVSQEGVPSIDSLADVFQRLADAIGVVVHPFEVIKFLFSDTQKNAVGFAESIGISKDFLDEWKKTLDQLPGTFGFLSRAMGSVTGETEAHTDAVTTQKHAQEALNKEILQLVKHTKELTAATKELNEEEKRNAEERKNRLEEDPESYFTKQVEVARAAARLQDDYTERELERIGKLKEQLKELSDLREKQGANPLFDKSIASVQEEIARRQKELDESNFETRERLFRAERNAQLSDARAIAEEKVRIDREVSEKNLAELAKTRKKIADDIAKANSKEQGAGVVLSQSQIDDLYKEYAKADQAFQKARIADANQTAEGLRKIEKAHADYRKEENAKAVANLKEQEQELTLAIDEQERNRTISHQQAVEQRADAQRATLEGQRALIKSELDQDKSYREQKEQINQQIAADEKALHEETFNSSAQSVARKKALEADLAANRKALQELELQDTHVSAKERERLEAEYRKTEKDLRDLAIKEARDEQSAKIKDADDAVKAIENASNIEEALSQRRLKRLKENSQDLRIIQQEELRLAQIVRDRLRAQIAALEGVIGKEDELAQKKLAMVTAEEAVLHAEQILTGRVVEGEGRQQQAIQATISAEEKRAQSIQASLANLSALYTQLANITADASNFAKDITYANVEDAIKAIDELQGRINRFASSPQIAGLIDYANKQNEEAIKEIQKGIDKAIEAENAKRLEAARQLGDQLLEIQRERLDAEADAARTREEALRESAKRRREIEHQYLDDVEEENQNYSDAIDDIETRRREAREKRAEDEAARLLQIEKDLQQARHDLLEEAKDREASAERDRIKEASDLRRESAELDKKLKEELAKGTDRDPNAIAEIRKRQAQIALEQGAANDKKTQEEKRQAEIEAALASGKSKEEIEIIVAAINRKYDLKIQEIEDLLEARKNGDAAEIAQLEAFYKEEQKRVEDEKKFKLGKLAEEIAAAEKARADAVLAQEKEFDDELIRLGEEHQKRLDALNDALDDQRQAIKDNNDKIEQDYVDSMAAILKSTQEGVAALKVPWQEFLDFVKGGLADIANATATPPAGGGPVAGGDDGTDAELPGGGAGPGGGGGPTAGGPPGGGGPSGTGPGPSGSPPKPGDGQLSNDNKGGGSIGLEFDTGARSGVSGDSSAELANNLIAGLTTTKKGYRINVGDFFKHADFLLHGYTDPKTGEYSPPWLSQKDYDRVIKAVKDFYTVGNVKRSFKDGEQFVIFDEMVEAGLLSRERADKEKRFLKYGWDFAALDSVLQPYASDVAAGKLTPQQAYDQAYERWGSAIPAGLINFRDFLKDYYGFTPAAPKDAGRPAGDGHGGSSDFGGGKSLVLDTTRPGGLGTEYGMPGSDGTPVGWAQGGKKGILGTAVGTTFPGSVRTEDAARQFFGSGGSRGLSLRPGADTLFRSLTGGLIRPVAPPLPPSRGIQAAPGESVGSLNINAGLTTNEFLPNLVRIVQSLIDDDKRKTNQAIDRMTRNY